MRQGEPSRTAYAAARHRAVHQLLEGGRVFADPLAVAILGADPAALVAEAEAEPGRRPMRLFIAARTRFAEETVATAHTAGTRQLVVLGAGLDTFGYRQTHPGLRVFEVDHPATQEWKRQRLAEAGIAVPDSLHHVPVDFERDSLLGQLTAAGFEPSRPAVFSWLGVVPYLTREAVLDTLRLIGGLPGGAQLLFDYSEPPESRSPEGRAAYERSAARVAALGEPWLTHFTPADLAATLTDLGLPEIEDLDVDAIATRFFHRPPGSYPGGGAHLLRAAGPGAG
ncbi:methyltransferase [Kitasatospora sp. MMS16-BH015]|uniref:class I SAM-dependent methyltransferase n=1 Tax=Kitasatospora sp. MMS16-BH015 TaxID=2018025 RepID=UPI000CA0E4EC|nr:class I SAM-dependent methyltransferase [Kitasatospora sp. MMS16-BH015]AUG76057.1 methyltransferase [Kitasatospora sp. MMS16-BH015]